MITVIVGILSFVPILYTFYFFNVISSSFGQGGLDSNQFASFMQIHMIMMIVNLGLLIYFVKLIYSSKKIKKDERMMWVIILLIANIVVFPVLWYKLVLHK